jgi:hypothetical protein
MHATAALDAPLRFGATRLQGQQLLTLACKFDQLEPILAIDSNFRRAAGDFKASPVKFPSERRDC